MREHIVGGFARLSTDGDIPNPHARARDARLAATDAGRADDVLPGLCDRGDAHGLIGIGFIAVRAIKSYRTGSKVRTLRPLSRKTIPQKLLQDPTFRDIIRASLQTPSNSIKLKGNGRS